MRKMLMELIVAVAMAAMVSAVGGQEAPGTACSAGPEPMFAATVDGAAIELHGSRVGSFGVFPVAGPAELTVHAGFDVRWVEVRPLSAKIRARIAPNHRDVTFRTAGITPLTIEFNDDLGQVVHLFPYIAEAHAPTVSTATMRYFGPGVHEAGEIDLKSGQSVYLAAGAWVRGAIVARDVRDVAILGHGVLDGSGAVNETPPYATRTPILLERTNGARLEGITVFDSQGWTVHLREADNTRIDGIHIFNPGAWNGDDGIDVDSSSHVLIENVFVRTNDDCVVVKNMADLETEDIRVRHAVLWNMPNGGNGVEIGFEMRSQPTHGIHVEDIDMIHVERGAAISIHNGDSAVVSDVSFEDIRVEDVRRKLMDFAVVYAPYGPDRPGSEAEIQRRMDRGGSWDAALCYLPGEKGALFARRGHIHGITVKGLQVVGGTLPYSVMAGFDSAHAVENVTIEGLTYQGRAITEPVAARLVLDNVQSVTLQ